METSYPWSTQLRNAREKEKLQTQNATALQNLAVMSIVVVLQRNVV